MNMPPDGNAAAPENPGRQAADLPICVDMDGTLLRVDTLHEAAIGLLVTSPRTSLLLPLWLLRGKAVLKEEVARRSLLDPASLPVNAEFLAWLRSERAAGRRIILCTAADRQIAQRVAAHFGLFDEVLSSDGRTNLRGARKAEALAARFGRHGFIYAGNDRSDIAVWRVAAEAIIVAAPTALRREVEASGIPVRAFDPRPPVAPAILRAVRPHQWSKNVLCFVPLVASGEWSDAAAWFAAATAFIAFCLVASSVYVVNDLADLAADRLHPRKRNRPFAAGTLSLATGVVLAPVMLMAGLAVALQAGIALLLLAYLACSALYTFWLKERPLVDVFVLAGLYCARIFAGGEASGHPASLWLLAFGSFLFFSLATAKRVSELQRLRAEQRRQAPRRGYLAEDAALLQTFGCAATFGSAIILSLYLQSKQATEIYDQPQLMWAAVPLLLLWQCRLWLATSRGYMNEDPIVYAAHDRVSWAIGAALAVVVALARFSP